MNDERGYGGWAFSSPELEIKKENKRATNNSSINSSRSNDDTRVGVFAITSRKSTHIKSWGMDPVSLATNAL
jgi:hypothetical protein